MEYHVESRRSRWLGFALLLSALGGIGAAPQLRAQDFDPTPAWPLCGRINENPPAGWIDLDGCPAARWGSAQFADLPLNSTYGPRQLPSDNFRFDFHRGIDIATPQHTPVFAMAAGIIKIAGYHPSYETPVVQIRHNRPGASTCKPKGCYFTNYLHLSEWVVALEQPVEKGQLIGYSGLSEASIEQIHFELRTATASDIYSNWQRDAIHPLRVLPYRETTPPTLAIAAVDSSAPDRPRVQVSLNTKRADITRIELKLFDQAMALIPQPGNLANARGYYVNPAWYDLELWNFQYTHKDSATVPWSTFGTGGSNQCPYAAEHQSSYNADVHLNQRDPADEHRGLFNGVLVAPEKFNRTSEDYVLRVTFTQLVGPARCIQALLYGASQSSTIATASWGDCGAP